MNIPTENPPQIPTQPLVSFLIVAHNAGSFVRPCLASIFAQTYPRIEIVIVDSASTDGAIEEVTAEFTENYAIEVVRSETNLGPEAGAMLGLARCQGEFVARIDADDIALSDRVDVQVRFLRSNPEKLAVGGDVLRIDESGNSLGVGLCLRSEFMRQYAAKWYIACFHTTLLVRRSALENRGYNLTLFGSGDTELIEWIAGNGGLGLVPQVVCLYRQHAASITERFTSLHQLSGSELRRRLSQTVSFPKNRASLISEDFSYLCTDGRSQLPRASRNQLFEDACRLERNWLGAAYFSSINGRWLHFAEGLARAAFAGTPWRELLALLVCRTLWPLRLRLANGGTEVVKLLVLKQVNVPLDASLHLAALINRLRRWVRLGCVAVAVLAICYFGLKPLPSSRDVPFLSQKLIYIFDHQNFLCNVGAFAFVAVVTQLCVGENSGNRRGIWRASAWLAILSAGIEFAQLLLPRRVFDPMDIVAGWLGVFLATLVFLPACQRFRVPKKKKFEAAAVSSAS